MRNGCRHLIWILIFYVACKSLFSTREPESPVDPRSNWIPPLSADQVFLNFQNAIYDRHVENINLRLILRSAQIILRFSNPGISRKKKP